MRSRFSPYQKKCDNYLLRSLNHEMYLQKVKNLQYLNFMIKDVMKVILEVNLGFITIKWL